VVFGWPDLGLGAALGSNVPALPLAVILSFLAVRLARTTPDTEASLAPTDAPRVKPAAVPLQFAPYLAVVALLAALTLPPPWAGLQPIDGGILAAAWVVYFVHDLARRKRSEPAPPEPGGRRRLLLALPIIAAGAVASVWGGQKLGQAAGLPDIVTGLFIIGFLCAIPESLSAWRFAKAGHATFGVSAAAADGIVSLTLALIPPALIGATIGDAPLYLVNLGFLVYAIGAYILMNHHRLGERLGPTKVVVFGGGYLVYLGLTLWILIR
jgi:cation:H+ antiporter